MLLACYSSKRQCNHRLSVLSLKLALDCNRRYNWITHLLSSYDSVVEMITLFNFANPEIFTRERETPRNHSVIDRCFPRFKSGDYILINLPRVALYEFHPFTISSAPEDTDHLRVHIQAVGNWTKLVHKRFKEMSDENYHDTDIQVYRKDLLAALSTGQETIGPQSVSPIVIESANEETLTNTVSIATVIAVPIRKPKEVIIINGPYSSCARYIFDCKHAVLIGSGIGITPYASILSSLMAHFRTSRTVCKHCHKLNYNDDGLWQDRRLKKVDFIWVNRDSKSFEWFVNLLCQFEKEQEEYLASSSDEQPFLTIQLYFTGLKRDESIDHVFLHHLTSVWAQEIGSDVFTGLKSPTRFGRPDWNELFLSLTSHDNSATAKDVDVFFCGPKAMGEEIQQHCDNLGLHYFEEKFWASTSTDQHDTIKEKSLIAFFVSSSFEGVLNKEIIPSCLKTRFNLSSGSLPGKVAISRCIEWILGSNRTLWKSQTSKIDLLFEKEFKIRREILKGEFLGRNKPWEEELDNVHFVHTLRSQ